MFSCSYIGFFSWTRKTTCSCECSLASSVHTITVTINFFFFQDPFQLWEKSAAGRSLFSRAHERHVFLFEKMIIFSKKIEAPVQKREKKSDNYLYKGHLPVSWNWKYISVHVCAMLCYSCLHSKLVLSGSRTKYMQMSKFFCLNPCRWLK